MFNFLQHVIITARNMTENFTYNFCQPSHSSKLPVVHKLSIYLLITLKIFNY